MCCILFAKRKQKLKKRRKCKKKQKCNKGNVLTAKSGSCNCNAIKSRQLKSKNLSRIYCENVEFLQKNKMEAELENTSYFLNNFIYGIF